MPAIFRCDRSNPIFKRLFPAGNLSQMASSNTRLSLPSAAATSLASNHNSLASRRLEFIVGVAAVAVTSTHWWGLLSVRFCSTAPVIFARSFWTISDALKAFLGRTCRLKRQPRETTIFAHELKGAAGERSAHVHSSPWLFLPARAVLLSRVPARRDFPRQPSSLDEGRPPGGGFLNHRNRPVGAGQPEPGLQRVVFSVSSGFADTLACDSGCGPLGGMQHHGTPTGLATDSQGRIVGA